ncbi:hypothetical protein [Streptomyces thermoalcalitolerans]|uniref:Uncharacterized protein n=1 Tax=Streptomyces thermoalcalitolerans TaxID=65605 RepID=A0ABN1ND68_9ACTN
MSRSRLPESEVRKYFIDPPDPAILLAAQKQLAEANTALVKAGDTSAVSAECRRMRLRRLIAAGLCLILLCVSVIKDEDWLGYPLVFTVLVLVVKAFTRPRAYAKGAEEWAKGRAAAAKKEIQKAQAAMREYQRLYDLAEPKPSDDMMDQTLAGDIAAIRKRAMRSLFLSPGDLVRPSYSGSPDKTDWSPYNSSDSQEPFVVYGPAFGEGLKVLSAVGKDGRRRYGRYSVMVICTTRYHIAVYRCVLDFFTGQLNNESTMEMHYQDVVTVRTHSDPDPGRSIEIEPRESQRHLFPPGTERCFELIVSGGVRLRIVTGLTHRETTKFRKSGKDGVVYQGSDPDFQAVADAVRMMLREKKGGVEGPSFLA